MAAAIKAINLGKRFVLGEGAHHDTLRDQLAAGFRRLMGRGERKDAPRENSELWALKDVSFEVAEGDVVGIVGHNGAGKSTLLKVLSQISEPTCGEVRVRGRVASLLEVGTGFHPELTGRENVFLNGAILGMSRREINARFDEIVAFSEVERFLDTPVKRYSSGMYMRLAFSVAAHLEPEILLVDEVLAVGDAAFQAKCLGKMSSVAKEGRTVLFVSHNLSAIAKLCENSLLLDKGRLRKVGPSDEIIAEYLSGAHEGDRTWSVDEAQFAPSSSKGGQVRVTSVALLDLAGNPMREVGTGEALVVRMGYEVAEGQTIPSVSFVVRIKCGWGTELIRMGNVPLSGWAVNDVTGRGTIDLVLPNLQLAGGLYFLDAAIGRVGQGFYTNLVDVVRLHVQNRDVYGSGHAVDSARCWNVTPHRWVLRREGAKAEGSDWVGADLFKLPDFQALNDE